MSKDNLLKLASFIDLPKIKSFASSSAVHARVRARIRQENKIKANKRKARRLASAAGATGTMASALASTPVGAPAPAPAPTQASSGTVAPVAPAAPTTRNIPTNQSTTERTAKKVPGGPGTLKPDDCTKGYPCGFACIERKDRCYDGIGPETTEGKALKKIARLINSTVSIPDKATTDAEINKIETTYPDAKSQEQKKKEYKDTNKLEITKQLRSIDERRTDSSGNPETDDQYLARRKQEKKNILSALRSERDTEKDPKKKEELKSQYEEALNILLDSTDTDDVNVLNEELNTVGNDLDYTNLRLDLFDRLKVSDDDPNDTNEQKIDKKSKRDKINSIDDDINENLSALKLNQNDPDYKIQEEVIRSSLLKTNKLQSSFDVLNNPNAEAEISAIDADLAAEAKRLDKKSGNANDITLREYDKFREKSVGIAIRAVNARALGQNSSERNPAVVSAKSPGFNTAIDSLLEKFSLNTSRAGLYYSADPTSKKKPSGEFTDSAGVTQTIERLDKIINPDDRDNTKAKVSEISDTALADKKTMSRLAEQIYNTIDKDPIARQALEKTILRGSKGGTNTNVFSPLEQETSLYTTADGTKIDKASYEAKAVLQSGKLGFKVRVFDEGAGAKQNIPETIDVEVTKPSGKGKAAPPVTTTAKINNAVAEYNVEDDGNGNLIINRDYLTSNFKPINTSSGSSSTTVVPETRIEADNTTSTFSHYKYDKDGKYSKVYANPKAKNGVIEEELTKPEDHPVSKEFLEDLKNPAQQNLYKKYAGSKVKSQAIDPDNFLDSIARFAEAEEKDPNNRTVANSFFSPTGYSAASVKETIDKYKNAIKNNETEITDPVTGKPTKAKVFSNAADETVGEKLEKVTKLKEYQDLLTMMRDADPDGANALTEQMFAIAVSSVGKYGSGKKDPVTGEHIPMDFTTNIVSTIDGKATPRVDVVVTDPNTSYNISVKRGDGAPADFGANFKDTFKNFSEKSGFLNFKNGSRSKNDEFPKAKPVPTINIPDGTPNGRDVSVNSLEYKIHTASQPGAITSSKNIFSNTKDIYDNDKGKTKGSTAQTILDKPVINVDAILAPADSNGITGVQKFKEAFGADYTNNPEKKKQIDSMVDAFVSDITSIDAIMRDPSVSSTDKSNLMTDIVSSLSDHTSNTIMGTTSKGSSTPLDVDFNHIAHALFMNRVLEHTVANDPNNIQYNNGTDDHTFKEGIADKTYNNTSIEPRNFSTYTAAQFDFPTVTVPDPTDSTKTITKISNNPADWTIDSGSMDLPFRADRGPFQYKNDNPWTEGKPARKPTKANPAGVPASPGQRTVKKIKYKGTYKDRNSTVSSDRNVVIANNSKFLDKIA